MEPIYVRQRLRPSRYAFLVNEGDFDAALRAVSVNTALWGGIYNPIVPLTPVDIRDVLLKEFDPDLLVNLTGADLPSDLAARYEYRIVSADALIRSDDRTNRRELGLGFHIRPLLRHVYETEVRFSAGPTRAAMIEPQNAPGWPEFVAFVYGSFRWLPDLDVNFGKIFQRALRARNVELSELTVPPDHESLLSPLDFTGLGLRLFGDRFGLSSHVIFIGDHRNLADLIEFWNIRATGRFVVFTPIACYRNFAPVIRHAAEMGRHPVYRGVQNDVELHQGPAVAAEVFDAVCDWIATLGFGQLPRHHRFPRLASQTEYGGYSDIAEVQAVEGEDISLLYNGQMTPIKMISPPYVDDPIEFLGRLAWSVELTFIGGSSDLDVMLALPREPVIERLTHRYVTALPGEVRIGRRGLVIQRDGISSTVGVTPIPSQEVIHALFRQAGMEPEPSGPGQYA
ncbi:MAG: hypothetical protein IRY83_14790, partial [Chloroflexi bacterium]|nr:hypothetical protein [Chloroflexota bacterium]